MKLFAFVIPLLLLVYGCRKSKEDPAVPPPVIPELPFDGTASFHAVMQGSSILYQAGSSGLENYSMAYTAPSEDATYSSGFYHLEDQITFAEVSLSGCMFEGTFPTEEEFYSYFSPGPRPFAHHINGVPGISIYVVHNEVGWGSQVLAQPEGSSFVITDAIPIDTTGSTPKVKVRATFNCFVSRNNGSMPVGLTNGIFVGVFSKN